MATIDIIQGRLADHQAALATTGLDPAWDKALHAYLKADIMQHADIEFGEVQKAKRQREADQITIHTKYGKEWRANPDPEALNKASYDRMQQADDKWGKTYCRAYWRAGRELALTPAPSMAAIAYKAAVMEQNELDNDIDFPADAMEVLRADFARLAREA